MLFKIGQVAKLTGVAVHTIRFWESHFPHIHNRHKKGETRYYDSFCIAEFIKIKELMKNDGMKISGIIKLINDGEIKNKKIAKVSNSAKKIAKIDQVISNTVEVQTIQKEKNRILKKSILSNISSVKKVLKSLLKDEVN